MPPVALLAPTAPMCLNDLSADFEEILFICFFALITSYRSVKRFFVLVVTERPSRSRQHALTDTGDVIYRSNYLYRDIFRRLTRGRRNV